MIQHIFDPDFFIKSSCCEGGGGGLEQECPGGKIFERLVAWGGDLYSGLESTRNLDVWLKCTFQL